MSLSPRHIVSATPALDTNAYSDGDRLGALMTLETGSDGKPVTLKSVSILDVADQGIAFDIMYFNASPTIASADNAAISITDGEMAKYIGHTTVVAGNYADFGGAKGGIVNTELTLKPAAGGIIYALLVSRGTPTHAAASLTLNFAFEWNR